MLVESMRLNLFEETFNKLIGRNPRLPKLPEFGQEVFLPGQNSELHNGFVNCANNPRGLKATFHQLKDQEGVGCIWHENGIGLEGYPGIVHGGVSAALLDELMTSSCYFTVEKFGVTVKATFKYYKTIRIGESVRGCAGVVYKSKQFLRIKAYLFRPDSKVFASSDGVFYLPTLKQFERLAELKNVPDEYASCFREEKQ